LLVTGQRAQLLQGFGLGLCHLRHDAWLAFAVARLAAELQPDIVRVEDIDRGTRVVLGRVTDLTNISPHAKLMIAE